MSSLKLVRCDVRRAGDESTALSPRFVPLEIFGLWDHLMTTRHGFEVVEPRASLWLDMEDSPEAAYGESQFVRVTEVTAFVFSERDDMFTRVRRYFPTSECELLKSIFLSHYPSGAQRIHAQVRERSGIWIEREVASVE
jgi:hypothetical protein